MSHKRWTRKTVLAPVVVGVVVAGALAVGLLTRRPADGPHAPAAGPSSDAGVRVTGHVGGNPASARLPGNLQQIEDPLAARTAIREALDRVDRELGATTDPGERAELERKRALILEAEGQLDERPAETGSGVP